MTDQTAYLLKNCTLLDVAAQKTIPEQAVYIADGTIQKIGTTQELGEIAAKLPATAVIDLQQRWLMPGLIDAHVHLAVIQAGGAATTSAENLRASETLLVLHGARNALETLKSGFTTVRDMGQGDILALREAIAGDIVPGPRIVACGWLGMTAGHQQCMNAEWSFNQPPRPRDQGVDGPWAVRRKVRQLVGQGVDGIKTFASGAGYRRDPFDRAWRERPNYTIEEMQAVVAEAHAAGRRVAAHSLVSRRGTKIALAAGVDTLEHGILLDDEDIDTMLTQGTFYVPTLAVVQRMWNPEALRHGAYLQTGAERAQSYLEAHRDSFRRAHAAGVKIALGSDTFRVIPQGRNACELEGLVSAGMTPAQALTAATQTAAEALGIDHMVGSIKENMLADLLVIDSDPLADITVLTDRGNIKMVIKEGRIVHQRR